MCSFSRCCCMYVSIAVLCGFHFRYKKKNNPATSPHPQKHTYYRGNNNTKTVDSSNVSLRKWWWNKFAWNIKTFLTVTAPVSLLPQNFPELLLLLHLRGTWGRSTEKVAPLACCMMYFFFRFCLMFRFMFHARELLFLRSEVYLRAAYLAGPVNVHDSYLTLKRQCVFFCNFLERFVLFCYNSCRSFLLPQSTSPSSLALFLLPFYRQYVHSTEVYWLFQASKYSTRRTNC